MKNARYVSGIFHHNFFLVHKYVLLSCAYVNPCRTYTTYVPTHVKISSLHCIYYTVNIYIYRYTVSSNTATVRCIIDEKRALAREKPFSLVLRWRRHAHAFGRPNPFRAAGQGSDGINPWIIYPPKFKIRIHLYFIYIYICIVGWSFCAYIYIYI